MIRNTHLTGSPVAVAKYMQNTHEEHLTRSGEAKATGYYSMAGGAPSEWFGKGAETQGLIGAVSAEDMVRALSGTVKHTGEDISTRGGQTAETRRMGEELTIAAPKSVSIMAVEDPRLVQAHQRAARAAMRYVEQEMVHARIGKGGGKGNDFSGNLTAGLYTHEDARDSATGRVAPHLHSHAIIANMIQRTDGKWVGLKLDWGHNNEKKMAADAVYKAELAREVKALGYQIEKGKGADFEIAGISREQIEYFSPRSQDIKTEIGGDRDGVSAKERQAAQNKTKGNKSTLNQIDQRYAWRREFREQNMDLQAIHANAARRESAGILVSQITAEDAVKSAVRHLSERDSVFSEQSLKSEALSAGLGDVSPEAIDAAIESRVGGLVYAGQAEGLNDCQFTTKTAIFTEAEILHRGKEGRGKAEAIYAVQSVQQEPLEVLEVITLDDKELQDGKRSYDNAVHNTEAVGTLSANSLRELSQCSLDANQTGEDSSVLHGDEGLDRSGNPDLRWAGNDPRITAIIAAQEQKQGFRFSDGQKSAVELALTSPDRHVGVVGSSGAGKTTSMKVIVSEYQKAGYQVIGVAPTSKAKRELQGANCNETITLADALLRKPALDESGKPNEKILYVMDEAGMVSSKDFDRFYKRADLESARTLVVGDPYQIESVEAGTPFAQLLETGSISHVKIDEVQRQRAAPELLKIAQAFASGNAAKGVELAKPFMTQVHVEKGQDKDEALAKVAADRYMAMTPQERADTYFIADTNKKRQAINHHIRDGLTATGALGADVVKITALDKLDLTKESATKSENYISKDGTAQVVVEFHRDYTDKDTGVGAEKGSQWSVVDTSGGRLSLQDRSDPSRKLLVNPVKIVISAYTARDMDLRTGDQVYFRQNDKTRDIINGTAGTAIVENGTATVKTDYGQAIPLSREKGEVMDYGYAITTHASQGGTKHTAIPVLTGGGRGISANLAYVGMTRETHELEIITDDIDKLCKGICKFSERQSAMSASKTQGSSDIEEIRQARWAADHELGQAGDLAEKRSQEQEHVGEPATEAAITEREEYQFSSEPETEMEIGE